MLRYALGMASQLPHPLASAFSALATTRGRRTVARWVGSPVESAGGTVELAAAIDAAWRDPAVVRRVLIAAQDGDELAVYVVLVAMRGALRALARTVGPQAGVWERFDDRHGTAVAALTITLYRVSPDDPHAGAALWWGALRICTERAPQRVETTELSQAHTAVLCGRDVAHDPEGWWSVAGVIEWATARGLSARDAAALTVMYDRPQRASIRAVAAEIGVSESQLESAHRRAVVRLASIVAGADHAALHRALVERGVRASQGYVARVPSAPFDAQHRAAA